MKSEELIYNTALAEVINLQLDDYHTLFLANMVLRKIRYPEEKMDEISSIVMKMMHHIYTKKKNVIDFSSSRSLDRLEEKLDECPNIPEGMFAGKTVSNVVKALCKKVLERLDEED